MSTDGNKDFYAKLPANTIRLSELLIRQKLFRNIPEDWHVIITDITGSTQAVANGRHQDVNLIATGSIVTVLNIAFGMNVTVPFFFGGDGATFIIPASLLNKVMHALSLFKANTMSNFGLELRTGTVPVDSIYKEGYEIYIAKFSSSATFAIPIVLGGGLEYAERMIKGEDHLLNPGSVTPEEPDLSGMQCRWDKIAPPVDKEEIVTLLIVSRNIRDQASVYSKVLEKMDELYGTPDKRQPISIDKLKLNTTFRRLGTEIRARLGRIKVLELIKTWLLSLYGYIYFSTNKGKTYLKSLVEMSDTLVIDGRINTVITGTATQRAALVKLLDAMEANDEITYGIHISGASIMSCYVRNLDDAHIHFVDGSEGGYTKAAKMLKVKL